MSQGANSHTQVLRRARQPNHGAQAAPHTCPAHSDGLHAVVWSGPVRARCKCGAWREDHTVHDEATDTMHDSLSDWTAASSERAFGLVTITYGRAHTNTLADVRRVLVTARSALVSAQRELDAVLEEILDADD